MTPIESLPRNDETLREISPNHIEDWLAAQGVAEARRPYYVRVGALMWKHCASTPPTCDDVHRTMDEVDAFLTPTERRSFLDASYVMLRFFRRAP